MREKEGGVKIEKMKKTREKERKGERERRRG